MYPTRIGLMFAANIIVICPCLVAWLVTPCIWLDITHPWNCGPWVSCYFFMIYMYKHLLRLLLVFVMKCYVSSCIALCLMTCIYCLFPSPMCLLQLPICTCLNSSPIACPPLSVLRWYILCIYYKIIVVVLVCDVSVEKSNSVLTSNFLMKFFWTLKPLD